MAPALWTAVTMEARWGAQLITMHLKPGRDSELRRHCEALPAAECPGTGLQSAPSAGNWRDPARFVHCLPFVGEGSARTREQSPSRRKDLEEIGALVADIIEGPEFINFDAVEDAVL